jgi:hypothetical protein
LYGIQDLQTNSHIEDDFEQEMKALQSNTTQERFKILNVGVDCCVFVQVMKEVDLLPFFMFMMNDLNENQERKTRYLTPFHPKDILPNSFP